MKRKEVTKLLLLLTLVNSIEGSHIVTNAADENLYMESQQSINSEEEKQKENGKKEFEGSVKNQKETSVTEKNKKIESDLANSVKEKNGLIEENGRLYYYQNGEKKDRFPDRRWEKVLLR